MKKAIVIVGLLLAMALVFVSCAAPAVSEQDKSRESVAEGGYSVPAPVMPPTEEARPAPPMVIATENLATGESWATERMIVRTGDMSLVVEDVAIAIDRITSTADGLGGYVVTSRVWKERERLFGNISIRVPAERFDDTVRALRGLAVDVTSEQTSSKDVTEEYVDLTAKLENLEATEVQLLRIMEKAETVEDILDVQRELSRTRGEIEQTKARMQYLERTSSTSLIQVYLEQSKLDVEFRAQRATVKEKEELSFYASIAGGFVPYSYEWDFGDGSTSTAESPVHAYRTAGSYTVSLTVTDDRGNRENETRNDYITVLPGWRAGNTASGAWNGLVTFGQALTNIFIWIGILSPVWIVVAVIAYGVIYWRRRQKKAQ